MKTLEEDSNKLVHLIYASAATEHFTKEKLNDLLKKIRSKNEKLGVTGMLLYHQGSFFQVLEGDEETLEALYTIISDDKRHNNIVKLLSGPIQERAFSDWSMGYANVSEEDLKKIPGLNDAVVQKGFFSRLPKSKTIQLLQAFKEGRWRQAIH